MGAQNSAHAAYFGEEDLSAHTTEYDHKRKVALLLYDILPPSRMYRASMAASHPFFSLTFATAGKLGNLKCLNVAVFLYGFLEVIVDSCIGGLGEVLEDENIDAHGNSGQEYLAASGAFDAAAMPTTSSRRGWISFELIISRHAQTHRRVHARTRARTDVPMQESLSFVTEHVELHGDVLAVRRGPLHGEWILVHPYTGCQGMRTDMFLAVMSTGMRQECATPRLKALAEAVMLSTGTPTPAQ